MKKSKKIVSLVIGLLLFAMMALGSGSSTPSSTESVKIESNDASKEGTTESSDAGSEQTEEKETTSASSDEVSYEITDTSFEYYTNSIGSVEYYGYVEILNTGSNNLYLENATFDLEDNSGHLLQSDDFISKIPAVIKPGEKGYFYNGLGSNLIDEGVDTSNGISLVPQITVKKATGEPARYEISDTDIREDTFGGVKVTGRVSNNTDQDCSLLSIDVIFYDSNGKVLAIAATSVTDLTAGSTSSFECSSMFANDSATINSVANFDVIAEDTYLQF